MSTLKTGKQDATDENRIGNVFTGDEYGIDRISVTLKEGVSLNSGSYVFVVDDDSYPIVYQVIRPYWFRPSFDFEESLITIGNPSSDTRIQRYRCVCALVGKLTKDGAVGPPRGPIRPFANVYPCSPEIVEQVIHPVTDWKIKLGINPETERAVLIDLNTLVRQGLIITGAQGTGKTTGLLTIVARSIEASPPVRFLLLDWTGEFKSIAKPEFRVELINWERLAATVFATIYSKILEALASHPLVRGRGSREYKLLSAVIDDCAKAEEFPTKKAIIDRLHGKVRDLWTEKQLNEEATKALVEKVESILTASEDVPEKPPPLKDTISPEVLCAKLESLRGVVLDFSYPEFGLLPDDQETKNSVATALAVSVWTKASSSKRFGCVVVTDEAHRLLPEGSKFDHIWHKLATEGGRNGCPLWIVARRLALVDKTITIEAQQNIVSFNTEDVDRRRIESDLGSDFAGMLGALPPGEAMVKSMGFRVPGQVVHVKFDTAVAPASPPKAKDRFAKMVRS